MTLPTLGFYDSRMRPIFSRILVYRQRSWMMSGRERGESIFYLALFTHTHTPSIRPSILAQQCLCWRYCGFQWLFLLLKHGAIVLNEWEGKRSVLSININYRRLWMDHPFFAYYRQRFHVLSAFYLALSSSSFFFEMKIFGLWKIAELQENVPSVISVKLMNDKKAFRKRLAFVNA